MGLKYGAVDEEDSRNNCLIRGSWRQEDEDLRNLDRRPGRLDRNRKEVKKLFTQYFIRVGSVPLQENSLVLQ